MRIHRVKDIEQKRPRPIPQTAGVYAFWWTGKRSKLMQGNRTIYLVGPGGSWVKVIWQDWWPQELEYPCLYVGKTTNLRKRYAQHLLLNRSERQHRIKPDNRKAKPVTTSCQVRYGIEHVFRNEPPVNVIMENLSFSFIDWFAPDNDIAERFYTEDRLIGSWRPWFNVDSER